MLRTFRILAAVVIGLGWTSSAQADNLMGDAVVLRALDKVTAATQDFTVPVGDTLQYGSLTVNVKPVSYTHLTLPTKA